MKNVAFPTTIVDGFFEDPDVVRDFALQQEFNRDEGYNWPGKRSKPLHEICPNFYQNLVNKVFTIFYDPELVSYQWEADAFFQIVNKEYGSGWVHQDPNIFTAIIYLSKNYDNSGTTLYDAKNPINAVIKNIDAKKESFKNLNSLKDIEVYKKENNDGFKPSVIIEGKYNRLAVFDSHLFHSANNFCDERLTLIVFVKKVLISSSLYPLQRMHKHDCS